MARLPKAREVIRVAEKLGFFFARQRGSHAIYRHSDGRRITIPVHGGRELSPAVFRQILRDMKIAPVEFWDI
jgi:predicted RNA binding protein YcfA (HicA-like mRNA interferase family)